MPSKVAGGERGPTSLLHTTAVAAATLPGLHAQMVHHRRIFAPASFRAATRRERKRERGREREGEDGGGQHEEKGNVAYAREMRCAYKYEWDDLLVLLKNGTYSIDTGFF